MKLQNYIVIVEFLVVIFVFLYWKLRAKWCKNMRCLVGKTVIITGANKGMFLIHTILLFHVKYYAVDIIADFRF